jgi:hypothetical protein
MFIAEEQDDFVCRGVALAADIPALAALRAGMRGRCEQSPMFCPAPIADGVSQALHVMWHRSCEQFPNQTALGRSLKLYPHLTQPQLHPFDNNTLGLWTIYRAAIQPLEWRALWSYQQPVREQRHTEPAPERGGQRGITGVMCPCHL